MRKIFLKNYHTFIYSAMIINGTVLDHLSEVDEICNKEYNERVEKMVEVQDITEELKKKDAYKWQA